MPLPPQTLGWFENTRSTRPGLTGTIQYLRSWFSLRQHDSDREKVQFVRYTRLENASEDNTPVKPASEKEVTSPWSNEPWVDGQYGEEDGGLSETRTGGLKFPLEEQNVGDDGDKITEWQAGWNVTNAIQVWLKKQLVLNCMLCTPCIFQGMFIVSFPYAVLQGGYWALIAMVLVAGVCCYTGKILVECLYSVDGDGVKVRVHDSYVNLAEEVLGRRFGGHLVNAAQIIELLMTCILYVLLCGDMMVGSFPESPVDLSSWIMISGAFLLPCAFLRKLRHVSWLSFWCTVAHMVINGIIIVYCFTRVAHWHWSDVQIGIDIWTFPISLGIIVFSYTSQIFLPSLEKNLKNRNRFSCMMYSTHGAAALFKVVFSWIGFLTWGMATKEVITNNLPNQTFAAIVNFILVVKALLSYPLPYYATVDLLQAALFQGAPLTTFPSCINIDSTMKIWALALRLSLVIFTVIMAIFIPHFAILMGLIGSFTGTMLSLVWPCIFHMKIKWNQLRWHHKACDIGIIVLGLFVCGFGMYYSSHALIRALKGLPPTPF